MHDSVELLSIVNVVVGNLSSYVSAISMSCGYVSCASRFTGWKSFCSQSVHLSAFQLPASGGDGGSIVA